MAGKWHLGFVPGATPKDRGFNHAFAFMGGGTSHFNDAIPLGTVEAFHTYYTRDGERVSLPDDFYSSEAYARQMNSWIKATPKEQPVFAGWPSPPLMIPCRRRTSGLSASKASMSRVTPRSIASASPA